MAKYKIGSVHGRFQLFHNDHLKYILSALEECEFLIIGITAFINTDLKLKENAKHRSVPSNNPFTYYERVEMISGALKDASVPIERFIFSPFPIDQPEVLDQFIPNEVICFTTIYDAWNREKIDTLQKYNYEVKVLWEKSVKDIEATILRNQLLNGNPRWKDYVPKSTIHFVEKFDILERIKSYQR